MDSIFSMVLIVLGLVLFESISSIDNAIINAEVLSTMQAKARKWFLLWGLLFAVFFVRGMLPWVIAWASMPSLGPWGALVASFSSDPAVHKAVEEAAPILLSGGGIFLVLLFLHWLFLEEKNYGAFWEPHVEKAGIWFFSIASIILAVSVWQAMKINNHMAFSIMIGSTAFFITHGFKQNAEKSEQDLLKQTMSDVSKIVYLEMIDMSFSIDGVIGAFAFTFSIPLILLGNGIGAFVVREFTIGNIHRIKRYRYLKNGAMYSILGLGLVMMLESFGVHIESWIAPVLTFIIIGFFFFKSHKENKQEKVQAV